MKIRTIVLTVALCLVGVPVGFAQDAFMGVWKLKVTVDSISGDGKPTHYQWTGKFDGKDYPVTGDPLSDARSYTKIDDRILGFNVMKGSKLITSGRIVVSGDGKSRTVTMSGTDAKGQKVSKNEVYEKQ